MRNEQPGEVTRLSRAVAAFIAAWEAAARGSAPPRLEVFLAAVPEADPATILRELLAVELRCRTMQGDRPNPADYLSRFPNCAETIQAVFADRETKPRPAVSVGEFSTIAPEKQSELGGSVGPLSGSYSFSIEGMEGLEHFEAPAAAAPARNQPLAPGTVIGNYKILALISQGGMGAVYKAEHRRMGRTVAVKMISQAALRDAEAVQRFHRETQAMARLEHPNIVTAHDADQVGDTHILVMQYVDGDDLWTTVKRRGPLTVDLAVRCLMQTARGMEYAHQAGVVHRDIKPSNLVLARNGVVKILDMGVARLEKSLTGDSTFDSNLTQAGNIMGTVDFMAPEQALDAKVADQRADIYSLGCTFYFLLTGQPLFAADTMMKRIMAHRFEALPSLHAVRADVPESLDAVFRKMIAKEAADRYQTMTEVLTDLAPFVVSGLTSPEADPSASAHMSFSQDPALGQAAPALLVKMPAVQQAPPDVAAEQTKRSAEHDTHFKTVVVAQPVAPAKIAYSPRRVAAEAKARQRRRILGAAAMLGLLVGGMLATLAVFIHIATDDGTFVIEAVDPEVKEAIRGTGIRVRDGKHGQPVTLRPGRHRLKTGEYEIDVSELPPGITVSTDKFQLKRGGKTTLKVSAASPEGESPPAGAEPDR